MQEWYNIHLDIRYAHFFDQLKNVNSNANGIPKTVDLFQMLVIEAQKYLLASFIFLDVLSSFSNLA